MRPILLLLCLAACNTAGPGFRGIPPVEQTYDGSRFLLRQNGPLVEVIRTSPEVLPKFRDVARKASLLLQDRTGCIAAWVVGDPAMMVVGLSCDGAKPPRKPKRKVSFSCDADDIYRTQTRIDLSLNCYKL